MPTEAELRKEKKIQPCNDDGSKPEFWNTNGVLIFRSDKSEVTMEMRQELIHAFIELCMSKGWKFACGGLNPHDPEELAAELALMVLHQEKNIPYPVLAEEFRKRAEGD